MTRLPMIVFAAVVAAVTVAIAPSATATQLATVTVKGPEYSKTFKVVTCVNKGETDIALTGKATGLRLRIVGKNKSGTLAISGLADLRGKLSSVVVGDAGNIKVKGAFISGGVKGPFTVVGMCG